MDKCALGSDEKQNHQLVQTSSPFATSPDFLLISGSKTYMDCKKLFASDDLDLFFGEVIGQYILGDSL